MDRLRCCYYYLALNVVLGLHLGQSFTLRFNPNGLFKILQVADMHYANGGMTACEDVLPSQLASCSDLNTTAFVNRMIAAEKPDLIVYTGDNIYGMDCLDSRNSLNAAFAAAMAAEIPWVAILGNHDQEGNLDRKQVMEHIVGLKNTLSQINPPLTTSHLGTCSNRSTSISSSSGSTIAQSTEIDGFGNYNLEIGGVVGSELAEKSVLNLYFLDSGDYSTVAGVGGYGWIKPSQQAWFKQISTQLQDVYKSEPASQNTSAPGLVFFHIPLPEFKAFNSSNMIGIKQEPISSPSLNSGFMATMIQARDVKAAFVGHDHVNDFCGEMHALHLCYAGGFGYHAYGKAGWSRRARVISTSLEKNANGRWVGVNKITTWKRLDDELLSTIDTQVLWSGNL